MMNPNLDQARANAREASERYKSRGSELRAHEAAEALRDLLAALDAAQPVAWVDSDALAKVEPQYALRTSLYGTNTSGDRVPIYVTPPAAVPAAYAPDNLAERIAYMRRDFDLSTMERSRFWAEECRMLVEAMLAANKENDNG